MNCRQYCFIIYLLILFNYNSFNVTAQTANPCGVVARISPAAHDSVVPLNTVVTFTSTSTNATSVEWLYDDQPYIGGPVLNYGIGTGVHKISLVAYNGNCIDTTTVVYFCAGAPHNIDSFLVADYGRYDINQYGTCIDNTPDGGFLMGGYNTPPNYSEQGILIKLKYKGCIDWSKYLTGVNLYDRIEVTVVYVTRDSNYYVAGTYNGSIPFLIKLDKNGNVLWLKDWQIQNLQYTQYLWHYKITSDPFGFTYTMTTSFNNGITVTKISPSGDIIWNKYIFLALTIQFTSL